MRRKGYAVLLFAFVLIWFGAPLSLQAKEAYTVDDLHITIQAKENGELYITEKYELNFNYYRNSFVRNITSNYYIPTPSDQGVIYQNYYFPVKDIECDRSWSVERNKDGSIVTIGDAGVPLIGKQFFTISYRVQTSDLQLPDHAQMLYWTLVTNLDTKVNQLHYEIEMPKAFDPQEVFASTGKYGDVKNTLSVEVSENTIRGELLQPLENNEMANIKVNLPNTYFTFPTPLNVSLYASLLSIGILAVAGLLFWRFGKDREVFVDVCSEAPKDISSAEIGYIMNRYASDKDLLTLFIDWGNRGFIRIHDHGERFVIERIRKMNEHNAKEYERSFFDAIFQNEDRVTQEQLREARIAFSLEHSKYLLEHSFTKDRRRHVYTDSSLILQVLMALITLLPSLLFVWMTIYTRFEWWELSLKSLVPSFFLLADLLGWVYLIRHRFAWKERAFFQRMAVLILVGCVMLMLNTIILVHYDIGVSALIVYLCVTIVLFFLMLYMDKRTRQGERWMAEVLGIREFIESVEPKQLGAMHRQNPKLFWELLPYAYAMGLADIWAKKFEKLDVLKPAWYEGMEEYDHFDTFLFWHTFHYCFYYMEQNVLYRPPIKDAGFFHFSIRGILPKRKK